MRRFRDFHFSFAGFRLFRVGLEKSPRKGAPGTMDADMPHPGFPSVSGLILYGYLVYLSCIWYQVSDARITYLAMIFV